MKIKIEIKSVLGKVLFELEKEDNTVKKTLIEAVKGDTNLRGADLRGAYLSDTNLRGAYLSDTNLRGADLRGAYLSGAYLRGTNLSGADLRDTNLRGADLSGAYLRGANLRGANLRGAYLSGAKSMDSEGKEFKIGKCVQVLGLKYSVFLFRTHMKIGCKCYSYDYWWKWDADDYKEDWKIWKPILKKMSENI